MYTEQDKKIFYNKCQNIFSYFCDVTDMDIGFWELGKNIPLYMAIKDIDLNIEGFCSAMEQEFGIKISPEKIINCCNVKEIANVIMQDCKPNMDVYKNKINPPKKRTINPCSEIRSFRRGTPFCGLLGHQCARVAHKTTNPNADNYCEYIKCKLYTNFQKLR